jgi:hypothetical protein
MKGGEVPGIYLGAPCPSLDDLIAQVESTDQPSSVRSAAGHALGFSLHLSLRGSTGIAAGPVAISGAPHSQLLVASVLSPAMRP